ncbi:MAG: DUF1080 domain-containing protein [Pseudomonadota bacterium]
MKLYLGKCTTVTIVFTILLFVAACASNEIVNLNRWGLIGAPVWTQTNDGVKAGPTDLKSYLVSTNRYSDFHLRAEFRIDDDTNSGIFIRCKSIATFDDINPIDCYEVNIWDNHPNQDFRTGSIVTKKPPETTLSTLSRWNVYEIVARGQNIQVLLNGQRLNSLNDATLDQGQIALQYWGKNELEFRNLTIDEL